MNITIKEVAKLAGVSPSTVSRVISDSSRISEVTKKVVRKAMGELGYHPNAIARSLVNRSTSTIGIVMPQAPQTAFLNPFFPQALSGISAAAHEADYCILLSTGSSEEEQEESIKSIIMGGRVDGVILMYSLADSAILEIIKEMKMPAIIIGKPIDTEGILYVDNDNVDASYKVTKRLIEKGHKKIAFMSGPFKFVVSLDRLDGYRSALMHYGLELDRTYIIEGEFSKESGYASMKELLSRKEKPTALVVTDDIMAFGAIDAIKDALLKIPQDIEIVSFNNVPLAELCIPSLTSVDIDAYSLGYESSKLIIEKIKGKAEKNKVIVPTHIVYRDSSKKD